MTPEADGGKCYKTIGYALVCKMFKKFNEEYDYKSMKDEDSQNSKLMKEIKINATKSRYLTQKQKQPN